MSTTMKECEHTSSLYIRIGCRKPTLGVWGRSSLGLTYLHASTLKHCSGHTPSLAFRRWSNANTLQASLSGVGAMWTHSESRFRQGCRQPMLGVWGLSSLGPTFMATTLEESSGLSSRGPASVAKSRGAVWHCQHARFCVEVFVRHI